MRDSQREPVAHESRRRETSLPCVLTLFSPARHSASSATRQIFFPLRFWSRACARKRCRLFRTRWAAPVTLTCLSGAPHRTAPWHAITCNCTSLACARYPGGAQVHPRRRAARPGSGRASAAPERDNRELGEGGEGWPVWWLH